MINKTQGHYIIFKALFNELVVNIPEETLSIEELNTLIGECNRAYTATVYRERDYSCYISGKNIEEDELYESVFRSCGKVEIFVPPKSLNPYFYLTFDLNNDNTYHPVRKLNHTKLIKEWIIAGQPKYWNPKRNSPLWDACVSICNTIDVLKNR